MGISRRRKNDVEKHGGRSLIGWEDLRKGQRAWSRWAASPVGRDRIAKTFTLVMPPACGRASGQKVARVTVMQKLSHVYFAANRQKATRQRAESVQIDERNCAAFSKVVQTPAKTTARASQSETTDRRPESKILSANGSIFIDVDSTSIKIDVETTS